MARDTLEVSQPYPGPDKGHQHPGATRVLPDRDGHANEHRERPFALRDPRSPWLQHDPVTSPDAQEHQVPRGDLDGPRHPERLPLSVSTNPQLGAEDTMMPPSLDPQKGAATRCPAALPEGDSTHEAHRQVMTRQWKRGRPIHLSRRRAVSTAQVEDTESDP